MSTNSFTSRLLVSGLTAMLTFQLPAQTQINSPKGGRNIIIFVADGLRAGSVNRTVAPTLLSVRENGVYFSNSHSLFPTFTTANASAIATGHGLGDTGDFSNTIFSGFPAFNTGNFGNLPGTVTPFVENDPILSDLDDHYGGNYLNEETLMAIARTHGYNTASIGKLGPVAIQDVTQLNPVAEAFTTPNTIFIDDATGTRNGVPLSVQVQEALTAAGLPTVSPNRSNGCALTSQCSNGFSGNNQLPGTLAANTVQQKYFADALTTAVLPAFVKSGKPFYALFWSRDPDGTQHNQGDSLNSLTPGINGPTSLAAIKNADNNLAQVISYVNSVPGLAENTDIVVTADHGFSTISKHEIDPSGVHFVNDYASQFTYKNITGRQEVNTGFLPVGFLAIDIAHEFQVGLYDPDSILVNGNVRSYTPVDPASGQATPAMEQHPVSGNGLIGASGQILNRTDAKIIVAANGGSDLIYVPGHDASLVRRLVSFLSHQNYVGGLFVDDEYSSDIPGALPLSSIGLVGSSVTPRPAISVNFKTFSLDPNDPQQTRVEIADSGLQEGQGMHGSLSRGDTLNNMAAIGPDFKQGFTDSSPVSNADLAPTLARILGFELPFQGTLKGRILWEATKGAGDLPVVHEEKHISGAIDGRSTVLLYQTTGSEKYYDEACLVTFTKATSTENPCR